MNALQQLYHDTIRRHAADPVGYQKQIHPTHQHEGHNPQCGDRVEIRLKLVGGMIEDIAFEGEAGTICMASASLMCEQVQGCGIHDLTALSQFLATRLKEREGPGDIGPLSPLLGVRPYPSRVQCATLPWDTAEKALTEGGT